MNDLSAELPPMPEAPDLFALAEQLLTFVGLGNQVLFSRQGDPLPRALALVTDYDKPALDRVQAVHDLASLCALVGEEPEMFADHVVVGGLVYASPLGGPLAAVFAPDGSADEATLAERRAELRAYVATHVGWLGDFAEKALLTRYAEEDRAEVAQERAELRAGVEAVFEEWQHTLGAKLLAAPVPTAYPVAGTGWSIEPMRVQLDMLSLTAAVPSLLPSLSDHAFARAVARLPDFHPQRLEELGEYLNAAEAGQRLPLNRQQGLLLYVASHVMLVLFVSDVLDGEGLDDLLLRRQPHHDEKPITPELVTQLREAAAIMLTAYIEVVREHEAEAADFQALEARLAPVLARAVE